tara:strand:+ start:1465 stop:3237 length:1773 start_codon:yes stop_codon:yes gene_type:complete
MNSYNGLDQETAEQLEQETILCDDCSVDISQEELEYSNTSGNYVCEDCWGENYICCNECDDVVHINNSSCGNGDYYCADCYDEVFSYCESCCEDYYRDDMVWNHRIEDYECESCYEHNQCEIPWDVMSNEYVVSRNSFINPEHDFYEKDTFNKITSKRSMGIEIETNYRNYEDSRRDDVWESISREIANSRHIDKDNDVRENLRLGRIRVVSDGSVLRGKHEYGNEVVMSPRRGDMLYKDATIVCDTLKEYHGAYVSRHCGLHLHVDIQDFDWLHLSVLSLMVKYIEPHIYTWVPQSRLKGQWSKPISQGFSDFKNISDREDFGNFWYDNGCYTNDKYNDKRYHGLNLHCHFQANQGLEIRYHGGTLNPEKILHWSIFWSNVVDTCYNIAEEMKKDYRDVPFESYPIMKSLFSGRINRRIKEIRDKYQMHSSDKNTWNIESYKRDSELLRRYIGLPKKDNPYLLQPMIDHILRRPEDAVMSVDNMFDTFNIPTETRKFMQYRMEEILSNDYTTPDHIKECFDGKSSIIEFDKESLEFKYVDNLVSQFVTTTDDSVTDIFTPHMYFIRKKDERDLELSGYRLNGDIIIDER